MQIRKKKKYKEPLQIPRQVVGTLKFLQLPEQSFIFLERKEVAQFTPLMRESLGEGSKCLLSACLQNPHSASKRFAEAQVGNTWWEEVTVTAGTTTHPRMSLSFLVLDKDGSLLQACSLGPKTSAVAGDPVHSGHLGQQPGRAINQGFRPARSDS